MSDMFENDFGYDISLDKTRLRQFPKFEEMTLPLLEILAEKELGSTQIWRIRDLRKRVADHFGLTEDQRNETLPSTRRLLDNRVQWAKSDLIAAKLATREGRGFVKITSRGIEVAKDTPGSLARSVLKELCPGFADYLKRKKKSNGKSTESDKQAAKRVACMSPTILIQHFVPNLSRETRIILRAKLLQGVNDG